MAENKKDAKNKSLEKAKAELLKRAQTKEKPPKKEVEQPLLPKNPNDLDQTPPADGGGVFDSSSEFKSGSVVPISIVEEMKKDYLDYSMSVIVSRAIPYVQDGLKPSQRRILVVMRDLQLWPTAHYRKSAKIAGDTTGNYHPHGEGNVYPTMVKLAQDFNTRYLLVDGQGNFGSIDGDPPAHMRYTEARMAKITQEMLKDLEKGTVLYVPNYDGTRKEPTVLPAAFPNLLCNGIEGIAVGMATKMAPHNLSEVIDALVFMIDKGNVAKDLPVYNSLRKLRESKEKIPATLNSQPESYYENYIDSELEDFEEREKEYKAIVNGKKDIPTEWKLKPAAEQILTLYPGFNSAVSVADLTEYIKGPDFPTGGSIYNYKDILKAYETGRGKVRMRGVAKIEESDRGRMQIIITQIPYQVNKAVLIQSIAQLVQNQKIKNIKDIRDESKEDIRIVIELKSGANAKIVLNKIYKYTAMNLNFNFNMIALVNKEPKLLNLKRLLELFIEHRVIIVIRRLEFELAEAKYQGHIKEGLLKALDFIDEVIKLIRASKNQDDARAALMKRFKFTEVQAQAILDMQLRKLAALERQKIEDEYKQLKATIEHHEGILGDTNKILKVIKEELKELKEKYGDERKTKAYKGDVDDLQEEDLVTSEEVFITISSAGYIKRVPLSSYKRQKRGGKGSRGVRLKENDYIEHAIACDTHDKLLFFTNKGRVFQVRAYEVPEYSRQAKGLPLVNIIPMDSGEAVKAVLTIPKSGDLTKLSQSDVDKAVLDEDQTQEEQKPLKPVKYLVMATKKGLVKKTAINQFEKIRQTGLVAIKLKPEDDLIKVRPTSGGHELMLVTKRGKSIRFAEKQVKATSRNTMGVKGISLKKEDEVISMDVIRTEEDRLFVISEYGYGKMTFLKKFRAQNRGGTGIFAFKIREKTGDLLIARIFDHPQAEIMVVSKQGNVIRATIEKIPILGRQTSGVRIMKMNKGDEVAGMAML